MASGKVRGRTVGTSELAGLLGISRQRVNELGRIGKITREADGRWDPDKVRAQLGRNLDARQASPAAEAAKVATGPKAQAGRKRGAQTREAKQEEPAAEPPKGTLLYEQWRLTREKADREALDRKREEGSLVKREQVQAAVSGMISAAKTKLRMIPAELCDKLATTKDPIRCRELMERKINEALAELAEYPACA